METLASSTKKLLTKKLKITNSKSMKYLDLMLLLVLEKEKLKKVNLEQQFIKETLKKLLF
jgi:hypothetical protein